MPPTPTGWSPMDLLLSHVTKIGVVGGSLYVVSQFALAIIHKSWETGASALGYAGLLLLVYGAAFSSKKTGDIVVSVEAEKRIANPTMPNASVVPAVNREIQKQEAETAATGGVPPVKETAQP